jgi:hypothetical protein
MKVFVSAKPVKGFWRAGEFWPHEGREANVTAKQFAILEAEDMLVVKKLDGGSDGGTEKPVEKMTKAELEAKAAQLGVDLSSAANNEERIALIKQKAAQQ